MNWSFIVSTLCFMLGILNYNIYKYIHIVIWYYWNVPSVCKYSVYEGEGGGGGFLSLGKYLDFFKNCLPFLFLLNLRSLIEFLDDIWNPIVIF